MPERLESDQLREIIELSSLITSSLKPAEVRRRAVEAAARLVDAERASLLLLAPRSRHLHFEVALGDESGQLNRIRIEPGQGVAGTVLRSCSPLVVNDAQNDPRFSADVDAKTGFVTRSLICAPLACKGLPVGVLEVINKRSGVFDEADLALVTLLANEIAIAVENASLYERLRRSFIEVAAYAALFATVFVGVGLWIISLGR